MECSYSEILHDTIFICHVEDFMYSIYWYTVQFSSVTEFQHMKQYNGPLLLLAMIVQLNADLHALWLKHK